MSSLRTIGIFIAGMLVQWWWSAHLAYWGAAPQILLVLTILVAARRGPVAAMLAGYVWGLFVDTMRADLFGASAMLYAFAGYLSGIVRKQIDLRAAGPLAAAVFLISAAYTLAFGLVGLVFAKSFVWVGWLPAIATPFLNALVAMVAAVAWDLWGDS